MYSSAAFNLAILTQESDPEGAMELYEVALERQPDHVGARCAPINLPPLISLACSFLIAARPGTTSRACSKGSATIRGP